MHRSGKGAVLAMLLAAGRVPAAAEAPADATAMRGEPPPPLVVALAESPPFAIKNADGTWSGLSVEIWSEIAAELGWRWEPREVDLAQIDGLLRDHSVDAALGAIAITAESAAHHDFSAPYDAAGLGFAQRSAPELSWRGVTDLLASSQVLKVVGIIAAAIALVGVLITLLERRRNAAEFGGPLHRSVATGMWWAAVTMTTVGGSDATPRTGLGRSLALLWMFVGLVCVAVFTASVTSLLTVGSLQGSVRRPADVLRLRLGAVDGGAGAEFLAREHVAFERFADYENALAGLADGKVDALVANTPSLRYEVSRHWQGVLAVSHVILAPVSYAIGLPNGSPLREPLDRAMLRLVEQDRWLDVRRQYLGRP